MSSFDLDHPTRSALFSLISQCDSGLKYSIIGRASMSLVLPPVNILSTCGHGREWPADMISLPNIRLVVNDTDVTGGRWAWVVWVRKLVSGTRRRTKNRAARSNDREPPSNSIP